MNTTTTYPEIAKMSRRDLSAGVTMGWNNWTSLTYAGKVETLPRLIAFEIALAVRANVKLSWPEVNGLTLEQARELRQLLLDRYDAWGVDPRYGTDLQAGAITLSTAVENRIERLNKTQATIARMTLTLAASDARRKSQEVK